MTGQASQERTAARDSGGQVIIVTGASAGIGKAICQRLGRPGQRLVLAARSLKQLDELRKEIESRGGQAIAVPTDVSDPNSLDQLISTTMQQYGRIDILINNAGIDCFGNFAELSTERILQTIETNLTGAILLTRSVVPHMLAQKSGMIVNMASTAGKHGPAFGAVYGATKAGLIAFTQGLRGELHGTGVSATVICPGFTRHGGIYDRIVAVTGKGTPSTMGGTTAEHVAAFVERSIQTDAPEAIVNWPPMRPIFAFRELFPRLGDFIIRKTTRRFLKRVADVSQQMDSVSPAGAAPHTAARKE